MKRAGRVLGILEIRCGSCEDFRKFVIVSDGKTTRDAGLCVDGFQLFLDRNKLKAPLTITNFKPPGKSRKLTLNSENYLDGDILHYNSRTSGGRPLEGYWLGNIGIENYEDGQSIWVQSAPQPKKR